MSRVISDRDRPEVREHDSSEDEISDVDSDAEELEQDIVKFNVSVRSFLASHHGSSAQAGAGTDGQFPRIGRGPRKAAEPRGDIKARLSKANRAFMMGDYQEARDTIYEIIRINAETHQAWTTLASIFREEGHADKALMSMVYAAHLRPKVADEWLKCAAFAVDIADEHPDVALPTARVCYSAALQTDGENLDARMGRGLVQLRLGQVSHAISDYKKVLAKRPLHLDLIRRLAEACIDSRDGSPSPSRISAAVAAYDFFFLRWSEQPDTVDGTISWYDIGIYSELLASRGNFAEAISKLKSQSRQLLGRQDDVFWDAWVADDREWDTDETRRAAVLAYSSNLHGDDTYGNGLPPDLRLRLALYRLNLGDKDEGLAHLTHVAPDDEATREQISSFPFLIQDLANRLYTSELISEALAYYRILCTLPGGASPMALLQMGRCHIIKNDPRAAEEGFLAAIEADCDNIAARVALASLYTDANEHEEALILITEAVALKRRREQRGDPLDREDGTPQENVAGRKPLEISLDQISSGKQGGISQVMPRRWRPRRLVDPSKRRENEIERARRLSSQYLIVQRLKCQIKAGRTDLVPEWMAAGRELIDDFRSSRKFYSWDKYLKFMGLTGQDMRRRPGSQTSDLDAMVEKLSSGLETDATNPDAMPAGATSAAGATTSHQDYQGISFDDWLDLFLDYAIYLAVSGQHEESYRVCEAARDCTVFTASADYAFQIYLTWSACAVYAADEETCVSISRQIMRDHVTWSDPYRMFGLLCKLCQTPISWYSSGPAQKFILRQIKAMDNSAMVAATSHDNYDLDVTLLVLYGHILFTSTSYAYALHYFLRARSRDPQNPLVLLSLGLAFIHYALKRQSINRQFLLMQGLGFMMEYSQILQQAGLVEEAHYAAGRTFQLVGLQHLAAEQYKQARSFRLSQTEHGSSIRKITAYNLFVSQILVKNHSSAKDLIKDILI